MKRLLLWALAGVTLPVATGEAVSASLYVIAAPNTTITAQDVRDIYLGEKQFGGPTRLLPIDNAGAQGAFLSKVMKMDAARYSSAWVKKSFREAVNPPLVKASDAEVIEYVRRTPGAVGYVSKPTGNVTVIQEF